MASAADAPLPAVRFLDARGAAQTLEPSAHKLTAIHFWATWCVPCVTELPEVDKTLKTYADKGFAVVAISMDGKHVEKVQAFFAEHGITQLTPYFDDKSAAFQALQIRGLPSTVFVDANGKILKHLHGPVAWDSPQVKAFIEEALK